MCVPAPVIDRYGADVATRFDIPYVFNHPGPGGVFLGSVGDQSHQDHLSSHNCGKMQESPVGGVDYADQYAHAYDARPVNTTVGMALVRATLEDSRVRYVNYDNVRYYPDGSTDDPIDHPTFHVSMLPGTHDDTRPFFQTEGDLFTVDQFDQIMGRLPGKRQQARDRNRAKATARVVRDNAVVLAEIAEAVNSDGKVDAQTLRVAKQNADKLALIVAADDAEGEDDEKGQD